MLKKYLKSVPKESENILRETSSPTTIIYNHSINISKQLVGENDSIGFRIVNNEFCKKLIEKLDKPIVSTSANLSGQPTAYDVKEINTKILKVCQSYLCYYSVADMHTYIHTYIYIYTHVV